MEYLSTTPCWMSELKETISFKMNLISDVSNIELLMFAKGVQYLIEKSNYINSFEELLLFELNKKSTRGTVTVGHW